MRANWMFAKDGETDATCWSKEHDPHACHPCLYLSSTYHVTMSLSIPSLRILWTDWPGHWCPDFLVHICLYRSHLYCIVFPYLCCIVSPYLFVLLSIFRGARYCCVTVTPHGGEQILSWSSLLQRQWTEPDESKIGMLCVDTWFRKLPEKVLIGLDWLFCK